MCLPSAEDTDVTKLHHPTRSHGPMAKCSPLSHDPVRTSHDLELPIMQASCDPMKLASHDSLASHDPSSCDHVTPASHDPISGSHDMDTLMASLSVFDATHLGRLGTAVSMETSSMIMMTYNHVM